MLVPGIERSARTRGNAIIASTHPMPNIRANQSLAGSDITDTEILQELPEDFRQLLTQVNGCILFDGGFHVRGAVTSPEWHSLRKAWIGESSLHRLFPAVEESDVPFGQDCFGDQFLLRRGIVHQLQAEIGEVESVDMNLGTFLHSVQDNPSTLPLDLNPALSSPEKKLRVARSPFTMTAIEGYFFESCVSQNLFDS